MSNGENKRAITPDKLKEYNDGLKKQINENFYNKKEADSIYGHPNKDVLDLLETDGTDLFFKGKNVHQVVLEEGKYAYTATFLNVKSDQICSIDIKKGSTLCDQIVQAYNFKEGATDLITVAKTFDNTASENFFYDKENIEFIGDKCKFKDEFILNNSLNSSGFYESPVINKDKFIELIGMED